MALKVTYLFDDAATGVEDILDPQTGDIVGKVFLIKDKDSGDLYRVPMTERAAKQRGSELMGISKKLHVAQESEIGQAARKAQR